MKEKLNYISGYQKKNANSKSSSSWEWKGINGYSKKNRENPNSVTEFFEESRRKLEDAVVGPGTGAGIGCGVGVGFGLVGGSGFGASPWNHVKMVFGVGAGCGVGLGFGYGMGFGFGSTVDSIRSRLFPPKPKKRIVIEIPIPATG
ncbi:hypothetical protein LguiB_019243 [Lonicera macranthoides]